LCLAAKNHSCEGWGFTFQDAAQGRTKENGMKTPDSVEVTDEFSVLRDESWIDLSDLVRMEREWQRTLTLISQTYFFVSAVLAAIVLVVAYVRATVSPIALVVLGIALVGCVASIGYLTYLAGPRRPPERILLPLVVGFSLATVTLVIYLLRGIRGDFYLLYLLPIISAAGYLGLRGGFLTGLVSSIVYLAVTLLSSPLAIQILHVLIMRAAIFILVASILGLIAEAHMNLLHTLRASQRRAIRLAITDDKTGLYNDRYLHLRLNQELERARRAGLPITLILADLDGFGRFNRTYGREVGNAALAAIGRVFQKSLRATDVAARWGPDEFALLLFNADLRGARIVAERVRDQVAQIRLQDAKGQETEPLVFSIGITGFVRDIGSAEELVQRALNALYEAQHSGGNCIRIWE